MIPAQIIWTQITIGTKMACGARNQRVGDTEDTLVFTVGRGNHRRIEITLDASDTYTVRLVKISKTPTFNRVIVEKESDVYVDNLNEIIYHMCNK